MSETEEFHGKFTILCQRGKKKYKREEEKPDTMNAWVMYFSGLAVPRKEPIHPMKSTPCEPANICTAHDVGSWLKPSSPGSYPPRGRLGHFQCQQPED